MRVFQDSNATVAYVLEEERGGAPSATFRLGVLTVGAWARAADVAGVDRDLFHGQFGVELLRDGLRGWEGAPQPFLADARGRPTDACLAVLAPPVRAELARAIYNLNVVGPDALGKS